MSLAKAANIQAFSWDEIEDFPQLRTAIIECIDDDERSMYELHKRQFEADGRVIRLLDAIGTITAHANGVKMNGSKSLLEYIEPKEVPRIRLDMSILELAKF